jgi:hypothetical protein
VTLEMIFYTSIYRVSEYVTVLSKFMILLVKLWMQFKSDVTFCRWTWLQLGSGIGHFRPTIPCSYTSGKQIKKGTVRVSTIPFSWLYKFQPRENVLKIY